MELQNSQKKICFYLFFLDFIKQNYILIIILILAIILRLLYFSPSISFPGANVVLEAMHLKEGLYDPNLVWHPMGIRYVLVALVSLSISLFGLSEFSVYFPIFLTSFANIILIYFLAKEMFDKKVGLFSAFLLAVLPLDVFNATIPEADILMNTFILSGILLYYCLRKYERNVLYFIIVGALFSLDMFVKIFVLLLLPILFFYEIVSGFNFRRLFYIGFGFLIVSMPFFIYQYTETGDFLYNIHVERGHVYAVTQIKENLEPIHQFVPQKNDYLEYPKLLFSVFPEKLLNTRHTDGTDPMINIYVYIFIIGLFVFHKKIERNKLILLLLWATFTFSFLEFYVVVQKVQRYLLIALYPIIILCAAFVIETLSTKARVMITFIMFIFLVSIVQLGFITALDKETWAMYGGTEKFIAYSLSNLPPKDIFVQSYLPLHMIQFYMNYTISYTGPYGYRGATDVKFLDVNLVSDWSQIHDVYILSVVPYSNMTDELGYYKKYAVDVINPNIQSMWPVQTFEEGGENGGKVWYIE